MWSLKVKDDLLVKILFSAITEIKDLRTEIVNAAADCRVKWGIVNHAAWRLLALVLWARGSANLVAGTYSLTLHKQLWKVLRATICHCPPPVFNFESRLLLLTVLVGRRLLIRNFLSVFPYLSLLGNYDFRFWEYFIFNLILFCVFKFSLKLQSNDRLYFTDMFLDHKQLVHETKFKPVFLLRQKCWVAESFK